MAKLNHGAVGLGRSTLLGLVAVGLAAGLMGAGQAQAGPSLLRTTLIVEDIQRAVAWYQLLGFEMAESLGGPRDPESRFPLASRSTEFELVILAAPDRSGGRIGLLAFAHDAPPVVQPGHAPLGIGSHVLVIEVADARAVFARLSAHGARLVTQAPTVLERTSADGKIGVGFVFHVFDPDGVLIEIMQPPFPSR